MKVFISHTFSENDKKLSASLKSFLEENDIEGYEAENVKKYDKLIRDKIITEIKNSDHMIAILTKEAVDSASVNQELGYALREGISPIIMLEDGAIQGVLIFGIDPENFTKETFSDSFQNILQHIKSKGNRNKNPENVSELSAKIDKLMINPPQTQLIQSTSEDSPEDLWYAETMQSINTEIYGNHSDTKKRAKKLYSDIKLLKNEVDRISLAFDKANNIGKARYAEILRPKKQELKVLRLQLRDIWSDF